MGKNSGVELEPDLENGRIVNENVMKRDGGVDDFGHWKQHTSMRKRGKAHSLVGDQQAGGFIGGREWGTGGDPETLT